MKRMMIVAMVVCILTMSGCQKKEVEVPVLSSPQPKVLTENILVENIETEDVITWDNSDNIQRWD